MTANLNNWTLILGFAMPLAISVVQQSAWSNQVRAIVAFVLCFAAAAAQLVVSGSMTADNLGTNGLAVAALAVTFYRNFWKPLGVAPRIEAATNLPTGGNGAKLVT